MYILVTGGRGGGTQKKTRNDVSKISTILLCPYLAASYLFITTLRACVYCSITIDRQSKLRPMTDGCCKWKPACWAESAVKQTRHFDWKVKKATTLSKSHLSTRLILVTSKTFQFRSASLRRPAQVTKNSRSEKKTH